MDCVCVAFFLLVPNLCLPIFYRKLLEEAPLMTKALREAQIKEKIERYPKVSPINRQMMPLFYK